MSALPRQAKHSGAIVEMRAALALFDQCNETFNDGIESEAHAIAIYRACCAADWDYYPDQWTPRQVREAIRGRAPTWTQNPDGRIVPTYAPAKGAK